MSQRECKNGLDRCRRCDIFVSLDSGIINMTRLMGLGVEIRKKAKLKENEGEDDGTANNYIDFEDVDML
ncbi:hypothetical protein J1N35_020760 [Gossypium stocksii]|uniref:Uncharacterized protein n=1 Tax=Gossypium stocksii TaxID=47602 RepID=A0A9D3VEK5_9ROSI|nr:hypothetical protein J1N35_020760 [Gossypium stocksii]